MNSLLLTLKRPFVRLSRIGHCAGFGVHSPFAFNLITQVIYQRTPYYIYSDLVTAEKKETKERDSHWRYESLKVKRLLFRLVNETQPHTILDAGQIAASSLYLQAAKKEIEYTAASELSDLFLEKDVPVDFLYVHDYRRPEFVEEVFRLCAARVSPASLFVVEGIGYTSAMRVLWKRMKQDERTGISFDLYDLGILFFDNSKIKQHYIVNF